MESSAKMEELTSGASGRIIPVLRNMGGSIPSYQSVKQSIALFYSTLLCFLLLLLPRSSSRPSSSSSLLPRSSSSPTPVSLKAGLRRRSMSARFRVWSNEDDAMRRRALAEAVKMVPGEDGDSGFCEWYTSVFLGARSDSLFYRSWLPATIIAGRPMNGRYAHFAKQLTSCQFGVYAMDWIAYCMHLRDGDVPRSCFDGHGGSDGLHGYVPSLDHVVADTGAFLEKVKLENPGIPCFLFGHSTGGAVVLKAASYPRIEQMLEGIILTSPALRVKPAHPVVAIMAPLFSMVVPRFQFKGANKRGIPVTRDPVQLRAKYADPLVYTGPIRVRTGHEILRISAHLTKNFKSVTVPFFILHGTADRVTDPLASRDLYEEAPSNVKDIRLYDGFLHDLLFEPERLEIGQDIIDWMEKKLKLSCCSVAD